MTTPETFLATGIILQAVEDWYALIRKRADEYDFDKLRRWFRSQDCASLCDGLNAISGKKIISRSRLIAQLENDKLHNKVRDIRIHTKT